MQELKPNLVITGGGEIGWFHGTWPLVRLTTTRELLVIGGGLMGRYPFRPQDVVGIEQDGRFAGRIRIRHNVPWYPKNIVFAGGGGAEAIINSIAQAGFTPTGKANGSSSPARVEDVGGWGFPFRTWFWLTFLLGWNAPIMADIATQGRPGKFTFAALVLLFIVSAGLLLSQPLQRLALKQGHRVDASFRPSLYFILVLSGFMSVIFGCIAFAR